MNRRTFDTIVIGSGIAGLSAALAAADAGSSVCIFTKEEAPVESNTWYAQGGIVYRGADDAPAALADDIARAGGHINNVAAVDYLAREGPALVADLLVRRAQVPFDRRPDGTLDFTREAAHGTRRIIHVGDRTGRAIEENLAACVQALPGVTIQTGFSAVDLITNSHNSRDVQERYRPTRVVGVYVLEHATGQVHAVFAPAVVLATGGIGNLYLHTSNPRGSTGDGIAMARRVGAEIINGEYVQFHPTVLYHRELKRFLISEALRGEGAHLRNHSGERFMQRYNAELMELAPRDEVARAIYHEMEAEGSDYVFLDARAIEGIALSERFPGIYAQCKAVGIDITREPIPVVPAAHYFCGGVKTGLDGATNVPGLYAVGETACTGVHGANRLASVSLLEGLLFGFRTGGKIAATPPEQLDDGMLAAIPDWVYPLPEEEFDPVLIRDDLLNIRSTMWNYAGIIRTRKRLLRAISDLNYLEHRVERFYRGAKLTREIVELRNSVVAASIIAQAAASNQESIGCHYIRSSSST